MSDRQLRLLVALCFAAAVGVAVVGFWFGAGGGGDDLTVVDNPAIDAIAPTRGAEVLQQQQIELDLAPGYEGTIVSINEVAIPPQQVDFDPGRGVVKFDPGSGKAINALFPDQNCVNANYWLISEGPTLAQSFTWCFTAA